MQNTSNQLDPLFVEAANITPEITCDAGQGTICLKGVSMPENVVSYYEPLLSWARAYCEHPHETTTIRIELKYFNTATSKILLEFLAIFEEVHENGKPVEVEWVYNTNDVDMLESGEDFAILLRIPFKYTAVE